ncbi:MAG: sulfotransferase [Hyphomonas sp.]
MWVIGIVPSKVESLPGVLAKRTVSRQNATQPGTTTKLIVVLGMHRSGTSVIIRSLQALGVELGDSLMQAVAGENSKGFWEDLEFNRLNERLLAKAGSAWHRLAIMDQEPFARASFAPERIEAAQLLTQKIRKVGAFAFKDPRTAILLPFWQCVFADLGIRPDYVITVRNPLETAESLRKRNGFDRLKSLVLWLKHMHAATLCTDGANRLFVRYDDMLNEPDVQLRRIAAAFGLTVPPQDSDAMQSFVAEFLDASLRHNRISSNEIVRDEKIPEVIPPFFRLLEEWANFDSPESVQFPEALASDIDTYLSGAANFLTYSDRVEEVAASLEKRAKTAEQNSETLEGKLQEHQALIQNLEAKSREQNAQIESQKTNIDKLTAELDTRVSELNEEKQGLVRQLVERDVKIEQQTGRLEEFDQVRAQLDARSKEVDLFRRQQAELSDELSRLKADHAGQSEELGEALKTAAQAEQNLHDAQASVDRLQAEIETSERVAGEHHRASIRYKDQLEALQRKYDAEEVRGLQQRFADAKNRAERLASIVAEHEATAKELRKNLRLQRAAIAEMRNSTSWRLTRPVRALMLLLTHPRSAVRRLGAPSDGQSQD